MSSTGSDIPPPAEGCTPPAKDTAPSSSNEISGAAKLIIETGLLTAFIGAAVFIAGWSYADRFFAELGLNLSAIEGIESESFSAYALWVFRDGWLVVVSFALVAGAFGIMLLVFARRRRSGGITTAALLALVAAAALIGSGYLGASRAARQVPELWSTGYASFTRIMIVAKKDTTLEAFLSERGHLGESTCLRKVFMDGKNLYAYAGYKSMQGQAPNIYVFPLDQVGVIEVIRNPGLCEP